MIGPRTADTEPVEIARCPTHGLHGQRHKCYVCGGPVEQVAMVPASELKAAETERDALRVEVEQLRAVIAEAQANGYVWIGARAALGGERDG
jgi:hypothetical protein